MHRGGPNAHKFLRAGRAMERLVGVWHAAGPVLTGRQQQEAFDHWNSFLRYTSDLGMEVPKRHLCAHLLADSAFFGNPRVHANWTDESLNRELKQSLRAVSQASFESFILLRFREVLKRGTKRKQQAF